MDNRLPAIALDGRFYSFLKALKDADRALSAINRLGKGEDEVVLTLSKCGYALWVPEPQARFSPPKGDPRFSLKPAFGPTPCLFLSDARALAPCQIQVADLSKSVAGIQVANDLYSVFRVEPNAQTSIQIVGKLASRGDKTLLGRAKDGQYLIGVLEPTGILV
ncbi:hypothetical protein C7271_01365 [filamentous cyanobacterium CCP5]|nr:hypothetical protein C7271_01365 [filamentous cyanobacterium CCP5]